MFLQSYKRLDNLCKDILKSEKGVTTYIEYLERINQNQFKDDYYKLKHYRYVRNKIVHENNASEENMCTSSDIEWIENFYNRILNQTDPLALHQQNVKQKSANKNLSRSTNTYKGTYQPEEPMEQSSNNFIWLLLGVGLVFLLFILNT